MGLFHEGIPLPAAIAGWLVMLPVLWDAARRARRSPFPSGSVELAWWSGSACIALLWLLAIRVGPGPAFGMLGVAIYALVFGRARAVLGITLALAAHLACTGGSWTGFGIDVLLIAVLPAALASRCQRWIERALPPNLFVFIIGNGMFTSFLVTATTAAALFLASGILGTWPASLDVRQYFVPMLLLAWSEAIVSGMLLSALVIFAPEVVLTYDVDRYLPRRSRLR
jgi:uncharacterized membrane protein